MRTLALLACLLVVAMAFAGCSGKGKDDGKTSSSSSSSSRSSSSGSSTSHSSTGTTGSSTSSSTGTSATNHAPTGAISVTVNGTNATFSLTGTDQDSDTLVWDLTFGDGNSTNGTTLPATVNYTYAAAGNYSANFTLTDGRDPVTYNATLNLIGATGGAVTAVFTEKQAAPSNPGNSAEAGGFYLFGASGCASFVSGMSGGDCVFFELSADYVGHAFTATTDAGDPDLEFWPACEASGLFATEGFVNDGPEAGTIPAGSGCVIIWAKLPPAIPTHTFTVL